MELIITDPHLLFIQQLYKDDIFTQHVKEAEYVNKNFRYAAYRQYILFQYCRLGAHNRRPVPSSCTLVRREKVLDPNGQYVEYVLSW